MAEMSDRVLWKRKHHEFGVERFYGRGAENIGDYHGGYLSFGLWEKGIDDYLGAAQNLVIRMGKSVGLNNKSHLLDVACGHGAQDIFIHERFGCKIDAVDVTWKHVQNTRRRAADAKLTGKIKVHHGSATHLPFPKNSFTHVLSVEGPEHFDTREKFFKEAYRALKPGGVMGLTDFVIKRHPRNIFERFFVEAARILWHVPKANDYDILEYKKKLENVGFKKISIKEVGALVIPGYFFEQQRKETRAEIRKRRGWLGAYGGFIVDYSVYKVFKSGLVEYVLVRAEK